MLKKQLLNYKKGQKMLNHPSDFYSETEDALGAGCSSPLQYMSISCSSAIAMQGRAQKPKTSGGVIYINWSITLVLISDSQVSSPENRQHVDEDDEVLDLQFQHTSVIIYPSLFNDISTP